MLISEKEFQSQYGHLYSRLLARARYYLDNPAKLKKKIELEEKKAGGLWPKAPKPQRYAYLWRHYNGFISFPERLKNFIVAQNEPRSPVRRFLPAIMDIEPNSRCNFRCIMCQVSGWKNSRRAPDMGLADFKRFIGSQPDLCEVKLHGMGDPLLHKDFFSMVRYLFSRHIWVRTSINGSLLHIDNNYKKIIDSGTDEILCSFDASTKEVFEKIRRGSNFKQVMRNFTLLNEYARHKGRLNTRMWVMVQDYNRSQAFELARLAKEMGFRRLNFSLTLNNWGSQEWDKKNRKLKAESFLSGADKLKLARISKSEKIEITLWHQAGKYSFVKPQETCPWPFARPYISSDLKVVPCCMLGNPDIAEFGDAMDFTALWNGKGYQQFRRDHLGGRIPEYCRSCYKK